MNELKFLAKIAAAAAVGISGPLVLASMFESKSHASHEKKMRGIYRSHIKVMDKLTTGGYKDATVEALVTDFDFYCIAEDLEK